MGFFGNKNNNIRYGALLDIGSGSVAAAIVASKATEDHPDIIWSKREYTPIKKSEAKPNDTKGILTSLMGAMMLLDSQGRQKLYEVANTNNIEFLQVTISAPWSYTTTKSVSYSNETEFEVSKELVQELLRTADKKSEEEIETNQKINDYGLSIINKKTLQVLANDYIVNVTGKQKAKVLKVIEATSVAQKNLVAAINEIKEKILPKAKMTQYSFMLPYFFVINNFTNNKQDYCLVDITYDGTEIGVVRNGFLNYNTHCPYGAYSLARDIADTLGVSPDEAYGYLSSDDIFTFMETATQTQKESVEKIIEAYRNKLAELFNETGDSLAIPKKIYVHGNVKTELFFNEQVKKAAKTSTRLDHATYNISSEIIKKYYQDQKTLQNQDTGLLITAQFFHTTDLHERFDHL